MLERTPDDARVQLEWRRGEVYAITVAINEHVPEDVIDQLSRFAERGIEE
jgi:methylglyoxal synthase